MHTTDLLYELHEGVAWIRFNRPSKRNALGNGTTRELVSVCEEAAANAAVRVVVISGTGDAFCAGGDLEDTFERGKHNTRQQWTDRIRSGPNALVGVLQQMPKPVIASVNGVAVGGGATIALACDLRLAASTARFCFPFSRIGLTPEFGCSYLLQRVVGLGRATELLLLGDFVDAQSALNYGLVNRVVEPEALHGATQELAARLAAMPAQALAHIKQLQQFAQRSDLAATLEQEALMLGHSFTSQEHRDAVTRFLNRKPAAATAAPGSSEQTKQET